MSSNTQIAGVLSKYLPDETVETCTKWIVQLNIHFRITKERASKFGDYRPVQNGAAHAITINHNLNKYAFLITFVHEVANLIVQKKHSRFVAPHGAHWKREYAVLLRYFLDKNIFPNDLSAALHKYIHSPAASSCSDYDLMRALKRYDTNINGETPATIHLELLPEGSLFKFQIRSSELTFKKGPKARTRYSCIEIASGRHFMFSGIADVKKVAL